jgi:hypothetical protein
MIPQFVDWFCVLHLSVDKLKRKQDFAIPSLKQQSGSLMAAAVT